MQINQLVAEWKSRLMPNTVSTYRTQLKMICKLCDRMHHTDIAAVVPRVAGSQPKTLTATEDEFSRLHAFASPMMKIFLLLTRSLGMRNSEALRICPANVQPDGGTLYVRRKMDGASDIPLTPALARIFLAHAHQPDIPLCEAAHGAPVGAPRIAYEWKLLKKKANVNPRLTPHDLRRTIAKRLYDDTKDLRLVQALLGHRNIATTLRYVGAADKAALKLAITNAQPLEIAFPISSTRPQ